MECSWAVRNLRKGEEGRVGEKKSEKKVTRESIESSLSQKARER